MPELPEVESVRRGLATHLTGARIDRVTVFDPRPLRRQEGGAAVFSEQLTGRTITAAVRRGKFLWLPLDDGRALSAHLGMSGQLLVHTGSDPVARTGPVGDLLGHAPGRPGGGTGPAASARSADGVPAQPDGHRLPRHVRVRVALTAPQGPLALDLVDQRMLGGMHVTDLVPTVDGAPGGQGSPLALLPREAAHIARDLLDPAVDRAGVVARMRASRRAVKTLLLDQGLVSGIGNIYADEGLWAGRIHGRRSGTWLGPRVAARLLAATAEVMTRALAVGGTSFDSLYVNADGEAGYFARSLEAYGRCGLPCRRCGTPLRTEVLGGRSHTFCPVCQTPPRRTRA